MYALDITPRADKLFTKLAKKNSSLLKIVHKKIIEIRSHPHHKYKFLGKPLQTFNRVHIDTHFVLIFKVNHTTHAVEIYDFDHHDRVYKLSREKKR